jgi:hypothetical protein
MERDDYFGKDHNYDNYSFRYKCKGQSKLKIPRKKIIIFMVLELN